MWAYIIKMLLTMKTKTDQSGGKSELGTSRDRWKGLTDCTASCKSQDTPCWKKGKIQHPLVMYRGPVTKCFCAFIKSTPAHCCALFSSLRLPSTVTTWKQAARWIYGSCSAQPSSGCEAMSSDCKWYKMQWKGHQRPWLHSIIRSMEIDFYMLSYHSLEKRLFRFSCKRNQRDIKA